MSDHSVYIWGSYAVSALVLVLNCWQASRARQAGLREILELQAEEDQP